MIELTQGQELALVGADGAPLTRLRMGIGWDKSRTAGFIGSGAPDVDLDASAVQFMGRQVFDFAFYNSLATRDGSVVHQGDNQSGAGAGDDEVIDVDLARVHGPVDTIFLMVSSYRGHSLEFVRRAYCRFYDGDGATLARYTITLSVTETGLVMAKLVRDGDGWVLRTIGAGIPVKIPTEAVGALTPFL